MKFLVIRFSSIGDIVLTTPVVRCLKKQVPDAEVHYLTKKSYAGVVEHNPYLDKVHTLNEDFEAMLNDLRAENFDQVIDLHNNIRSLKVKRALGVPSHSFKKLNIEKWIFTTFKVNVMPDKHIVDRYLDATLAFEVKNDEAGLDYFIPEKDRVQETDIPTSHLAGYIGIVIGATYNTKKLPVEKLQELCKMIDHPIILLGGKEDRAIGEDVCNVDRHKIYNACGKFNLNESADLVRRSKLIISNDTGLMHIAAALKKPIISIWGNTVPSFGMYPYYGKRFSDKSGNGVKPFDVVEVKGLYCRPCSKIGYQKCPHGHFKCMKKIDIPKLTLLVNERLKR
ncbi:MAG: glycosyltransferase family 9 protein [Flavitalea sp.]